MIGTVARRWLGSASVAITDPTDVRRPTERALPPTSAVDTTTRLPTMPVSLGALPAVSVVVAVGLLMVVTAYNGARVGAEWAETLYWGGLLVVFVPVAAHVMFPSASRGERIGSVCVLGVGLYLVKLLHSPLFFTLHDEMVHWRTVNEIMRSGHLFRENSIIPVSPLYPGLENATAALMSVGGFSIFGAGALLLGVARLVFVLALYLLFEQAGGSSRIAGLSALLYMANPSFVVFDSQFSYESLALPLAALAVFAVARRVRVQDRAHLGLAVVTLFAVGAAVTTHHLTAYALVGFLTILALTGLYVRYLTHVAAARARSGELLLDTVTTTRIVRPGAWGPHTTAILALVASLAWLIYVATYTIGYLAPHLSGGVRELLQIIAGEATSRQLFRDYAGEVAPLWERLVGFASVFLILLGLPFGLLQIWRGHRMNAIALGLAVAALAYPASLPFRLTTIGAEAASRANEFLYLALAFVIAVGVVDFWLGTSAGRVRIFACAMLAGVLFLGGVIVGIPPWARLPGPYLVAADSRSVEPQGVGAATWVRQMLGPDNRVLSDRINGLLMASHGDQRMVTGYDRVYSAGWLFAPELGPDQQAVLRDGGVRYVVVDRRLSTGLPMVGIYVESGEPNTLRHTTPIDPSALAKLDRVLAVHRIFDSGYIMIYDVRGITNAE
jgi:hypothetical protein